MKETIRSRLSRTRLPLQKLIMKKFRPLAKSRISDWWLSKQGDKVGPEGYLQVAAPKHSRALGTLVLSAGSMGKLAGPRRTYSGSSELEYHIGKQGAELCLGSLGGKSVLN